MMKLKKLKLRTSILSTITGLPNSNKNHKKKRPSPISTLPTEILIQILKHLHSPGDLHSCVLVSRQWSECAVELLWYKPSFPKYGTINKMASLFRGQKQTFTYFRFIRQLNLGKDNLVSRCGCLLNLIGCKQFTGEGLAQVLPHFTNLVAINLTGAVDTTSEAIIGLANVATQLQDINLSDCTKVTDDAVVALATCPLRRVGLNGLGLLTDDGISTLVLACPMLWGLDLSYCELITNASVRLIWTHLIHMRVLGLSHCSLLTDAAFPAPVKPYVQLDAPKPFPISTATRNGDLPPLVINQSFEHLRMLDLSFCSLITCETIEGILLHAPNIRNLDHSGCANITDKMVTTICFKFGRNHSRYFSPQFKRLCY